MTLNDADGNPVQLTKRTQIPAPLRLAVARAGFNVVRLPSGPTLARDLTRAINEEIGTELSAALLRLSLRDSVGYTGRARVFALTNNAELGVDMSAARNAGTSLSTVIKDLEDWQVKFIELCSNEVDRDTLLNIIREIHSS